MGPQPGELLRPRHEIDDLVEFVLRLVHPGDILERDLHIGLRHQLRLGAPHRQQPAPEAAAAPAHHRPRGKHPDADEQQRRQDPRHQRAQRPVVGRSATILYVVLGKLAREVRRYLHRAELRPPVLHLVRQRATDDVARDRDLLDLAAIQILLELAVGDHVGAASPAAPAVREQPERRDHHESGDNQPDG